MSGTSCIGSIVAEIRARSNRKRGPTVWAGTDSVRECWNCALSAMTKNSPRHRKGAEAQIGPPNRIPLRRQQLPLMKSEIETALPAPLVPQTARPRTDPNPPIAIVVNARSENPVAIAESSAAINGNTRSEESGESMSRTRRARTCAEVARRPSSTRERDDVAHLSPGEWSRGERIRAIPVPDRDQQCTE